MVGTPHATSVKIHGLRNTESDITPSPDLKGQGQRCVSAGPSMATEVTYHSGGGAGDGGGCTCEGVGDRELTLLSAPFYYEPKTALNNKFD